MSLGYRGKSEGSSGDVILSQGSSYGAWDRDYYMGLGSLPR